jgi:hypothetical protein
VNTPKAACRQINKNDELRNTAIAAFWDFSADRVLLNDLERLLILWLVSPLRFTSWFA